MEYNVHEPEVASGASQTNTPRWVSAADGTLPAELEQQMRDEIENRLHQLEHMVMKVVVYFILPLNNKMFV